MSASLAACPSPSRSWTRLPLRPAAAPALFALSLGLFTALSCLVRDAPFHPLGTVGFFDLKVYRLSAAAVLQGRPLYAIRFPGNLGFTYPPFAGLALTPLRLLPVAADEVLVTALNAGLLVAIAWWALGLPSGPDRPAIDAERRRRLAWLAAAVGLWCEPVNSALGYGQIDVLIAALVVFDLTRRPGARGHGLAIGLAAGLKLTPLIFVAYLLLTGRLRAARNAALGFAATIAVGALVLPGDSLTYWTGAFLDTSRVSGRPGAGGGPADQSLRGLLLRALPGLPHHATAWLVLAALVACLGLTLAARAARRGDLALGFGLTAITGLLVSPVSWTHQWTLAMPGLLLLAVLPRSSWVRRGAVAGALAFIAGSYAIWVVIAEHRLGLHLDAFGEVAGNLYVIAGLVLLLGAAAGELRYARRARRPPAQDAPLIRSGRV